MIHSFFNYCRRRFIHWLVKDLFNTLYPEEILSVERGRVLYRGKLLDDDAMNELIESADKFSQSAIWKLLSDDAIYHANKTMYETSRDFDGMMFGKAKV